MTHKLFYHGLFLKIFHNISAIVKRQQGSPMKNTIILFTACLLGYLNPIFSNPPTCPKSYDSRVVYGYSFSEETLLDEDLIRIFVSHPEALEHFLDGRWLERKLLLVYKQRVEQIRSNFPSNPRLEMIYERILEFLEPWPYEEITAPFITFGIADTSTIEDSIELEQLQDMQIKIFKNWLARYRIGPKNCDLTEELLDYCNHSSLDILSAVIGPMLKVVNSHEFFVDYFIGDDRDEYDNNDNHSDVPFERPPALQEIQDQISADLLEHFPPPPEYNDVSVEQAMDTLKEELDPLYDALYEKYFSRDAIIFLFLKVTNQIPLTPGSSPQQRKNAEVG